MTATPSQARESYATPLYWLTVSRVRSISHAEDEELKGDAVMSAGAVADALGLAGAPSVSEDVIVARDLLIALDTGKAWHIAHLSTARALDLVRWSRAQGGTATCEVTPHHLLLTDETVRERGAGAKVNPPLRSQADARALSGRRARWQH